jgi:hypothetical protein
MNIPDLRQSALTYLDIKFKSSKTRRHIFDKVLREQRKNRNYKFALTTLLILRCMVTSQQQKDRVHTVLAYKLSSLPEEAREFVIEVSRNLTEFFNSAQIDPIIKDLFTVSIYKLTVKDQRCPLHTDAFQAFSQLLFLRIGHLFEVGRFGQT